MRGWRSSPATPTRRFASVEVERPAAGARVNTLRTGQIVVGRYTGIANLRQHDRLRPVVGTARRHHRRRRHVSRSRLRSRRQPAPAAADPRARPRARLPARRVADLDHEPVDWPGADRFDRGGAIIAFARPVGNKSPDVDPASTVLSVSTGEGRWTAPTIGLWRTLGSESEGRPRFRPNFNILPRSGQVRFRNVDARSTASRETSRLDASAAPSSGRLRPRAARAAGRRARPRRGGPTTRRGR